MYTPEMVERICGTPKDKFLKVGEMIAECSSPTKTMTSMYALGWTQHSSGSQNIRTMAMLQLILGNIGVAGRRHERAARSLQHPGSDRPRPDVEPAPWIPEHPDREGAGLTTTYMSPRQFKPLRPGQTSYWQNYGKFFVSFQKAMWGDTAHQATTTGPTTTCPSSTCRPTTCCACSS